VDLDGSVLVATEDSVFRLGSTDAPVSPVGTAEPALGRILDDVVAAAAKTFLAVAPSLQDWLPSTGANARDRASTPRFIARVDRGPDGTLLVQGGSRKNDTETIAVFDDDRWTVLPQLPPTESGVAPDTYDPVWAADGSLWVGTERGLGRYADEGWTHVPWEAIAPRAAAQRAIGFGPARSLASTLGGDLWVGVGQSLSRYRDGEWTEFEPLAPYLEDVPADGIAADSLDLDIGADDTMWALISMSADDGPDGGLYLLRRQVDRWSAYPVDDLMAGTSLHSERIAVADDGAALLLVGPPPRDAERQPEPIRLLRFDGLVAQELARLPGERRYRIADVGPDGSVWLIGGAIDDRETDRLHLITPNASALPG
jgi:hypothetical protein